MKCNLNPRDRELPDLDLCGKYLDIFGEVYDRMPATEAGLAMFARYLRMRLSGESHNMAEMLALKAFPGVHGLDSTFMVGTHHQDSVLDNYRYHAAQDAGIDTNGKRYLSGMARFPNDPEAWVSGRDDVVRLCESRGWNSHGMVEYEAPSIDRAPEPDIPIAKDIVDQHVAACLRAFPEGDHTPQLKEDIRESVTQELSGAIEIDDAPHCGDYSYEDSVRMSSEE